MDDNRNLGDQVVKDISKDFKVMGSHRVHNWYAFAIIGIVFGMAVAIIYVSNRNVKFSDSKAATDLAMSEPVPPTYIDGTQELTAFDEILQNYKDEHGGQVPDEIVVYEGTPAVIDRQRLGGEDREVMKLGSPVSFPLAMSDGEMNLRRYLSTFTNTMYDVYFGSGPNAQGHMIFNGASAFTQSGQMVLASAGGGSKNNVTPLAKHCHIKYSGSVTVSTPNGGSQSYDVAGDWKEAAWSCTSNAQCKEDQTGNAAADAITYYNNDRGWDPKKGAHGPDNRASVDTSGVTDDSKCNN